MRYVTDRVMLDRELFASLGGEAAFAQALVDHELGHVVGLGHVEDSGELMYEHALERTAYGPGDRECLARGCVPVAAGMTQLCKRPDPPDAHVGDAD